MSRIVFLFFLCVPFSSLHAAPVIRLELKPAEQLPGLPVKFEITAESSDATSASIPNRVSLLVTRPNGQRFLAGVEDERVMFAAREGDRIEVPARKPVDLTFWYRAPWLADCRLQQPGQYTFQLIAGTNPAAVLSSDGDGLLRSNEAQFRVLKPEGEDEKAFAILKHPSQGCARWYSPSLSAEIWEKYPDSTYAMYALPTVADLNEQIALIRQSLQRWPDSPVSETVRRDLAFELVRLTDRSVDDHDLATALAAGRESVAILTDLSRRANDPMVRKEAADALENAYTEQDVLDEVSGKRNILIPFVECVEPTAAGMRAWFGVANQTGQPKSIAVGPGNKMTPAPHDRGQLTNFPSGIKHLAFSVDAAGPVLDWHLDGTNVQAMLHKSFQCPPNLDDYLKDLPRKD
ncbi:MAG: hypothetical protein NDJ92_11365 [Thermoanaerobaculia bacterium]|nr:hypothetical protein [Thermoanaerobaculia bacterium]